MSAELTTVIAKIERLPPRLLAEVGAFVELLLERESDRPLVRAAAKLGEASFAAVWDNDADAVYDRM